MGGLKRVWSGSGQEQVVGCCGQSNVDSGSINCAVFFENVWRYEIFKRDSAPRSSLVIALSLKLTLWRQILLYLPPGVTLKHKFCLQRAWTPPQQRSASIFINKYELSILLQGRIVVDFHKTIRCVYTPKHTWFYFTFNSVLSEKVDLMHRLIVLLYFR
jgi:hypothetical protein